MMGIMKRLEKAFCLCALWALSACVRNEPLEYALELAGDNRKELEYVLHHYASDSLKLRASEFLITNMPYHFSVVDDLEAPDGKSYYPDIMLLGVAEAVKQHCDSLLMEGYRIRRRKFRDINHVSADYLITQIDLAFEAWRMPWAKDVSFEDFCHYVLPYRSENESLSDVRRSLMLHYVSLLDSAGVRTMDDACQVMNCHLKRELRFSETGHPLKSTLEETKRSGIGPCDALSNYMIYAMRAVGIPAVRHQTIWTRMDNSHFWVSVKKENGFFEFDPGENLSDSLLYDFARKEILRPAKVYRREYEADFSLLSPSDDGYVSFLKSPLIRDVTEVLLDSAYTIRVPMYDGLKLAVGTQVYLCAFNLRNWIPIALGACDDEGNAVFEKVAGRNFLMVAKATETGLLEMVSVPFCTNGKGGVCLLEADTDCVESYTFNRKEGEKDRLLGYWDRNAEHFIDLKCTELTDTTQTFEGIPKNALLFYRNREYKRRQPVGMIVNGEYVDAMKW